MIAFFEQRGLERREIEERLKVDPKGKSLAFAVAFSLHSFHFGQIDKQSVTTTTTTTTTMSSWIDWMFLCVAVTAIVVSAWRDEMEAQARRMHQFENNQNNNNQMEEHDGDDNDDEPVDEGMEIEKEDMDLETLLSNLVRTFVAIGGKLHELFQATEDQVDFDVLDGTVVDEERLSFAALCYNALRFMTLIWWAILGHSIKAICKAIQAIKVFIIGNGPQRNNEDTAENEAENEIEDDWILIDSSDLEGYTAPVNANVEEEDTVEPAPVVNEEVTVEITPVKKATVTTTRRRRRVRFNLGKNPVMVSGKKRSNEDTVEPAPVVKKEEDTVEPAPVVKKEEETFEHVPKKCRYIYFIDGEEFIVGLVKKFSFGHDTSVDPVEDIAEPAPVVVTAKDTAKKGDLLLENLRYKLMKVLAKGDPIYLRYKYSKPQPSLMTVFGDWADEFDAWDYILTPASDENVPAVAAPAAQSAIVSKQIDNAPAVAAPAAQSAIVPKQIDNEPAVAAPVAQSAIVPKQIDSKIDSTEDPKIAENKIDDEKSSMTTQEMFAALDGLGISNKPSTPPAQVSPAASQAPAPTSISLAPPSFTVSAPVSPAPASFAVTPSPPASASPAPISLAPASFTVSTPPALASPAPVSLAPASFTVTTPPAQSSISLAPASFSVSTPSASAPAPASISLAPPSFMVSAPCACTLILTYRLFFKSSIS